MRSTLKLTLTAFAAAAVIFAGCKKGSESSAKATNTIDATTAAKHIAVTFYNAFTGKYGGANANGGINAPSTNKANRLRINRLDPYCGCSYVQPYCGLTLDTVDNFTYNVGDTVKNVDSKFKFIYTCSNTALDGYMLTDSITYTDKGPLFINKYQIAQNYIVTSAASDYSLASMHGYLGDNSVEKILDGAGLTTYSLTNNTQYAFSDIKIKTDGTGIVSGTVTFTAVLSEVTGGNTLNGSFTGTMTFLGDNKAMISVTYQGHTDTFEYDLITFDQTKVNQCDCGGH